MHASYEAKWWMTGDGRLFVGASVEPGGCLASGTICPGNASGMIRMFRGEPAMLTSLPRGLLDELSAHFPGVRWWVQDVPERAPARAAN